MTHSHVSFSHTTTWAYNKIKSPRGETLGLTDFSCVSIFFISGDNRELSVFGTKQMIFVGKLWLYMDLDMKNWLSNTVSISPDTQLVR